MTSRVISLRYIMDILNEIIDIKDEDPVRAHQLKDNLYARLLTDISNESLRLSKAEISEMASAAVHAETITKSLASLHGLAKAKV